MSTALMYAFGRRSDTRVLDEPLYAHYLRASGVDHPGRDLVLAAQDSDGERVIHEQILGPCPRPLLFAKNMAHHLIDVDWNFLSQTVNVILTRHPRLVLPSLARKLSNPRLEDTGYDVQVRLLGYLRSIAQEPPVVDARILLTDPVAVLSELCRVIGIRFHPDMLHWPTGPKPDDGVWAEIWYHDVHMSTGFAPYREKSTPIPPELESLLETCMPLYNQLIETVIDPTVKSA